MKRRCSITWSGPTRSSGAGTSHLPLQHAALLHSVYGTDVHRPRLLSPDRRSELRRIAGADAERLAYLFSVTPRGPLFAGTHLWARDLPRRGHTDGPSSDEPPADRAEFDALVVLHMANLAEQARARTARPAPGW